MFDPSVETMSYKYRHDIFLDLPFYSSTKPKVLSQVIICLSTICLYGTHKTLFDTKERHHIAILARYLSG